MLYILYTGKFLIYLLVLKSCVFSNKKSDIQKIEVDGEKKKN